MSASQFLFQFIKTSDHTVFLYVTKVGTIPLYPGSLRKNSKYYNEIVNQKCDTSGRTHAQKIKSFQTMTLLQPDTQFVLSRKCISGLVLWCCNKLQLVSFPSWWLQLKCFSMLPCQTFDLEIQNQDSGSLDSSLQTFPLRSTHAVVQCVPKDFQRTPVSLLLPLFLITITSI